MKEQLVKEWFERGKNDLEVAKFLLDKGRYFDVVLFHIHQAVEKYLKGFLIYRGWELKRIHDLETLITEAMTFDLDFQKYLDLGRKLTAFYYESRYPPGKINSYSQKEVEQMLRTSIEIIDKLREKTKL